MISDYVLISLKNLKKRGIRSWLTMLGIFIGIAAVVSLISLGNGLQTAITGQFSSVDPDKLVFSNVETGFGPPGSTAVEKLDSDDEDLLNSISGVDLVIPRLIRIVEVMYNDESEFSYATNIPSDNRKREVVYDALNVDVLEGRLLSGNDRGKIVLGNDFTDPDKFGKEIRLGRTLEINGESFEVVGFLKKASTFTINSVIFFPEEDLENLLDIEDEADILIVQVQDRNEIKEVAVRIEERFRKDRNLDPGEEDFSIETPEQSIQTINTILVIINIIVTGIAGVSLLVGGIGITNTMYTSVLERTKEIGVMKAIGAKNSDILKVFLLESSLLGLVGGIIGAAIGLALAYLAAFAVNQAFPGLAFKVSISLPLLALAISFSFFIGTISGLLPALQASRLEPVEALRG